jgi:hypothetical protein
MIRSSDTTVHIRTTRSYMPECSNILYFWYLKCSMREERISIGKSDVARRGDTRNFTRDVALCDRAFLSADQFATSSTSSQFNEKEERERERGVRVSNHHPFFDNRIATLQLVELTGLLGNFACRAPSIEITQPWLHSNLRPRFISDRLLQYFPEYWLRRSEV